MKSALLLALMVAAVTGNHHGGNGGGYGGGDDGGNEGGNCEGRCEKRKCRTIGYDKDKTGSCDQKGYVCCVKTPDKCSAVGGFCVDAKKCPAHHVKHENSKAYCGSKKSACCVPDETLYARCSMQPAGPDQADQVTGDIFFRQQIGEALEYKVDLAGFDASDDNVYHAYHVHVYGDLSNGCGAAGGHFNPEPFTKPINGLIEVGDLGKMKEEDNGIVKYSKTNAHASLSGEFDITGRSIVVHALENGGPRAACCVIGRSKGDNWPEESTEEDKPSYAA